MLSRRRGFARFPLLCLSSLPFLSLFSSLSSLLCLCVTPLLSSGVQADTQFALLLLGSGAVSAGAMAATPAIVRRFGAITALVAALCIAAVAGAVAFRCPGRDGAAAASATAEALHSVSVLVYAACVAMLQPALQSLACSLAPLQWHGRSFGMMKAAAAVGAIAGGLGGAQLFEVSLAGPAVLHPRAAALWEGAEGEGGGLRHAAGSRACGALPFDVAVLAMGGAALAVLAIGRLGPRRSA